MAPADDARSPRERILDATYDLIASEGVRGVTHRRVAKAAGASLSSTTYHFASLDDLLEQTFARAVDRDIADLRAAIGEAEPADDVVEPLAAAVVRLAQDRPAVIVANELGTLAYHQPAIARLADHWISAWTELISRHVDDPTTADVAMLMVSALIPSQARAERPDVADVRRLLRKALGPATRSGSRVAPRGA